MPTRGNRGSYDARRRFSLLFKGRSSHKSKGSTELYPIVEDKDSRFCETVSVPPPEVKLCETVLIVPDRVYAEKHESIKKVLGVVELSIELYPVSTTKTTAFRERHDTKFQVNTLYRKHPLKEKVYLPCTSFVRELDREKMMEALFLCEGMCVETVIINKALYDKVKDAKGVSMKFDLPEATPLAAGSMTTNRDKSREVNTAQEVRAVFQAPKHGPYIDEKKHVYYANGLQPNVVSELVGKVMKGFNEERKLPGEVELSFSSKEEQLRMHELQLDICNVVGVGVKAEHSELSEFEYVFKVKFFEQSVIEKLKTMENKQIRDMRKSLSRLGSMRTAFHSDWKMYREDILFNDGQTGPIDDWVRNYSESTWKEWLSSQACDSTLSIPIVLYGPSSYCNSLAIFTWNNAIRAGPGTFFTDWSLNWNRMLGTPTCYYESLLKNVRFSPHQQDRFLEGLPELMDDDEYDKMAKLGEMTEKHKIRLLLRDTEDAKDLHTDKNGDPLPFGLRVLVLDAEEILKLVGVRDSPILSRLKCMLGPETGRSPHTLSRYPPIAALLVNSHGMKADSLESVYQFARGDLGILNVIKMPTFTPPNKENQLKYEADEKFRQTFTTEWFEIAEGATSALDDLLTCITNHEFSSHRKQDKPWAI